MNTNMKCPHRRKIGRCTRNRRYLIDAAGQNVAQMTADKAAAEFICRACDSFQMLLEACKASLHLNTEETSSGSVFLARMCAVDDQLRDAIAKATDVT